MAASFQSAEFLSPAALVLFVQNNPSLTSSAGWLVIPLTSGTYRAFGTIDPATIVTTGLTNTGQGWKITGQ